MSYQHTLRTFTVGARTRGISRYVELLLYWHERSRTRGQLVMLDDSRLEDIGLTRAQASEEARKWFWEH